jgi:hypothetical protein
MRTHRLTQTGLATFAVLTGALLFGAPTVLAVGPPEAPLTSEPVATALTSRTATLNGVLNPNNPGEPLEYQFEYNAGPTCTGGSKAPEPAEARGGAQGEAVSTPIAGLQPNTQYTACLLAKIGSESAGGAPVSFLTLPLPPVARTGGASAIATHSASIAGAVNPENGGYPSQDDTTYYFEYGQDATYGKHTFSTVEVGEGTSPVEETATLTGLIPDTAYHYRIVASNDNGGTPQVVYGQDEEFETPATPPLAITGAASDITSSSATIAGGVDPVGLPGTYELDYNLEGYPGCDPEAEPGHRLLYDSSSVGGNSIAAEIAGLLPDSTYYYRAVVSTADGVACGAVQAFTTLGTPIVNAPAVGAFPNLTAIAPLPPAREPASVKPKAKSSTNAQKLAKALRACRKKAKGKNARAACEAHARAKYGKSTKKKGE